MDQIIEDILRFLIENPKLLLAGLAYFFAYLSLFYFFQFLCQAEDHSHAEHDKKPKRR